MYSSAPESIRQRASARAGVLVVAIAAVAVACHSSPPPAAPAPKPEPAAVAVATPAAKARPAGPEIHLSKDPRLVELYSCWFEHPYSYMFANVVEETEQPEDRGEFTAGINGILSYGGLLGCVGKLVGSNERWPDIDILADFARVALLAAGERKKPFRFFNPELVKWGYQTLLPDPELIIAGTPAQVIYDKVFFRFSRMMTEAYVALLDSGRIDREKDAYWAFALKGKGDGLDWLDARYKGWLPAYDQEWDGTTMTGPMAIGFWLRRTIDGTADEVWIGLRQVLWAYDREWYSTLKARYSNLNFDF